MNNLQFRLFSFIREIYKTVTNNLRNVLKKKMIIDGPDQIKDKNVGNLIFEYSVKIPQPQTLSQILNYCSTSSANSSFASSSV